MRSLILSIRTAACAFLLQSICVSLPAAPDPVAESPAWRLHAQVQVHAAGIYLNELIDRPATPLPHLRLAAPPAVGQAIQFTRTQVAELVRQVAPELVTTNWTGPAQVRVSRRMRLLEEAEIKESLTGLLQRELVKDRGELELRFTRPWNPASIADEPFTVHILDLPTAGVTPNFVLRFELRSGQLLLGNWQVPVQAKVWREIWVAGSPLARGQLLRTADVITQRRDVLLLRDALTVLEANANAVELAEYVPAGAPLTLRSLRLRPVVKRGRVVDAVAQNGSISISMRAEVLEDGVPGQLVRARNLKSKREFRAKVQNEETIVVAF